MSKFVSDENLRYILTKLAKSEDIPAIKLTSMDAENPIILRDLDSNVYVLHGYILPYDGSSDMYAAQTPIQAGVAKSSDASYVQLFFPYNNMLQYFEITDNSYTEKTINLNEVALTSDIPTNYVSQISSSVPAVLNPTANYIPTKFSFKNPSGSEIGSLTTLSYNEATTELAGLMSASDKVKLNALSGFTDDVVTVASAQTISGVKTFSQTIQGNISGSSGRTSRLAQSDARETNENPSYYMNLGTGTVNEFKRCTTIGISESTYCQLETHIMWKDNSGGRPVQIAHLPNNNTYRRYGTIDTAWSSWVRIATSSDLTNRWAISSTNTTSTYSYVRYTNGFAICTLKLSSSASSSGQSNTLPITFANTSVYGIVATSSSSGNAYAEPRIVKNSGSQVTVYGKSMYSSSTYYADTYDAIAIGWTNPD